MENEIDWKARALKAEARVQALAWVVACAEDIVSNWPKMTLRTLGSMNASMETLKKALGEVGP